MSCSLFLSQIAVDLSWLNSPDSDDAIRFEPALPGGKRIAAATLAKLVEKYAALMKKLRTRTYASKLSNIYCADVRCPIFAKASSWMIS